MQELFFRVIPRESLACFWSKRDVSKGSKAPSIKMTVDQFNAVSLKVVSTILNAVNVKSKQKSTFARSKAVTKWIAVALVCVFCYYPVFSRILLRFLFVIFCAALYSEKCV